MLQRHSLDTGIYIYIYGNVSRGHLSQVVISSEEDLNKSLLDPSELDQQNQDIKMTSPSRVLQGTTTEEDEGIDYRAVLKREIKTLPIATEDFRKTRGALSAEAKAVVRAQHLRAMANADRIPRWAYGFGKKEKAPEYLP